MGLAPVRESRVPSLLNVPSRDVDILLIHLNELVVHRPLVGR